LFWQLHSLELGEDGPTPARAGDFSTLGEFGQICPSLSCPGGFRRISALSLAVPKVGRLIARMTGFWYHLFSFAKYKKDPRAAASNLYPQMCIQLNNQSSKGRNPGAHETTGGK
jgi:hypothetical protein